MLPFNKADLPINSLLIEYMKMAIVMSEIKKENVEVKCAEHEEKPIEFYCFRHDTLLCALCVWDHADHKGSVKVCTKKEINRYVSVLRGYLKMMSTEIVGDIE
mgnify:CR=1 FL=1